MDGRPGFRPDELKTRYDVESITEDEWHAFSGRRTREILTQFLPCSPTRSKLLLNAGAGVYELNLPGWQEVSVDLFAKPLRTHRRTTVCANVEQLPFGSQEFGAVVCVGEVLGYCDPARAISEFARVVETNGLLICDFENSLSVRHWFTPSFARAADLTTDVYNGTPEPIWIYDPKYIASILRSYGFSVVQVLGTHSWSALARRLGAPSSKAVRWEAMLSRIGLPSRWADLTTIVASRSGGGRE